MADKPINYYRPEWELDDALKGCDEAEEQGRLGIEMAPHFLRALVCEIMERRSKDPVSSLTTIVRPGTTWQCPVRGCGWAGINPETEHHKRGNVKIIYRHCPECGRVCSVKGA